MDANRRYALIRILQRTYCEFEGKDVCMCIDPKSGGCGVIWEIMEEAVTNIERNEGEHAPSNS